MNSVIFEGKMVNLLNSPVLRLGVAIIARLRYRGRSKAMDSAIWGCRWVRICGILHSDRLCFIRQQSTRRCRWSCDEKFNEAADLRRADTTRPNRAISAASPLPDDRWRRTAPKPPLWLASHSIFLALGRAGNAWSGSPWIDLRMQPRQPRKTLRPFHIIFWQILPVIKDDLSRLSGSQRNKNSWRRCRKIYENG